MKLKKIKLENIRSYLEQEIIFPEGSILLSGDIGSGKTSVLLGIEFALFGLQPGQRGNSILRNGKDAGGVELEFEIDNQKIRVERTLKRSKRSVSQDYCAIQIGENIKEEMSVTELKDRVLQLLRYPKEFSRKQNLLYRFTVYTPQEEMKEIITPDPKTRVNTLRHVFGIDKYKKILENSSVLASKLREEKRLNQGLIEGFEDDHELLASKEDELEAKQNNLKSVEKELFLKKETRKKVEEEKEEISDKIEQRNKLKQEAEKAKIMVSNKKENLKENQKMIFKIKEQIEELKDLKVDESQEARIEEEIRLLKVKEKDLQEEVVNLSGKISSLNLSNQENQDLKESIPKIDHCPVCLQDVDSVHKSNVSNKLEKQISENVNKIKDLSLEMEEIKNKRSKLELEIVEKQKNLQELKIQKIKIKDLDEKKERISELEKNNVKMLEDIKLLENQENSLRESAFELNKFENIFKEKEKLLEDARKEEKMAEIKVAELKKEIEVFERQILELKERLEKSKRIKEKLNYIIKLETWISNVFSPLISTIEKNVMIKLKSEFSELFSRWFGMLVSDTFDVSLDENFTPLIMHYDYELDYEYLSGGERTAIALAYRLSLNQVVNSLLSKIKTRDLVILDEPTDGFSEQQLDKMRDVLRQLDVAQLLIVSHEQKIESFVENVIRFKKEHGVSQKTKEEFM